MENPININREMANALRALAVTDHSPVTDRVDVVTALAKLGIKCQPLGGALFIGGRETLALADYIDRPAGDADDVERFRFDIAISVRQAVSKAVAAEKEHLWDGDICGERGLLDLCDFAEALGLDVKYYNEEYPAVAQSEAAGFADEIDVQTCIYVRGECNMHMIGPDGVADSTDDAESVARDGLIRQWNTRWTPSEGDGHGVAH